MGTLFGIKGGIAAAMVLAGLIALAVISRNWSCRQQRPPRPPHSWSFAVDSVSNGATIVVKAGLRERRTATITLADIAAPPTGDDLAEASRANLERLAGQQIRVEIPRARLLFATQPLIEDAYEGLRQQDEESEPTAKAVEARGPMVGVVYGENGACLNLGQVMDGFVTCLPSAPKEWKAEETKAKKAKRGIWGAK